MNGEGKRYISERIYLVPCQPMYRWGGGGRERGGETDCSQGEQDLRKCTCAFVCECSKERDG